MTLSLRALFCAMCLSGCVVTRSTLHPVGPAAQKLAALGWPLLLGFSLTTFVMWALIAWVAMRRNGSFDDHAPVGARGGMGWVTIGGFVIPGITFAAVFVVTLRSMSSFPVHPHTPCPGQIRVIGHQWWWEIQYLDFDVSQRVTTANEIHIPTDRDVDIELVSADVIHSFWAPRLHGKVDLVPGMVNHIQIRADQPGVYAGACAEFCGLEHAKMRFTVIAEPSADYEAWLAHMRAPEPDPRGEAAIRGEALFMRGPCVTCHTIRGTPARATVGPDLTHFALRNTIAAGALPKDLATLHAWVANAPSLKPGTRMPAMTRYRGDELGDLVAYLQSLD